MCVALIAWRVGQHGREEIPLPDADIVHIVTSEVRAEDRLTGATPRARAVRSPVSVS